LKAREIACAVAVGAALSATPAWASDFSGPFFYLVMLFQYYAAAAIPVALAVFAIVVIRQPLLKRVLKAALAACLFAPYPRTDLYFPALGVAFFADTLSEGFDAVSASLAIVAFAIVVFGVLTWRQAEPRKKTGS
jgi:hypothetical protein